MPFSVDAPILYVLVSIIIAVVLAQSAFFMIRAIRRAKAINMDPAVLKKTIISAAIFTIAPAVAILVGVVTLSKSLGVAIPWLRLSVIGSLTYETTAAERALSPLGLDLSTTVTDPSAFVTVLWVMTLGIALGLILIPLLTEKIQKGVIDIEKKDKKWMDVLSNSLFLGMISAFLGFVFCDVTSPSRGTFEGFVPVCVMLVSAIIMVVLGSIAKKTKARWITDYAVPISLIAGMASAIPFTNWFV